MPETLVRNAAGLFCEEVDGVLYPIEEANPVPQGDWHFTLLVEFAERLRFLLEDHPTAKVFGDMLLYWVQGDAEQSLAPDVMVFPVIEEPDRDRNVVRLWEEASTPVFVLEVLSKKTRDNDLGEKRRKYQDELRVPEYFVCEQVRGKQRVWGYRRVEGAYQEVAADERGWVWSEELRVWFGADERGKVGVWDASGQSVSRQDALMRERNAERQRADEERERADEERQRAEVVWKRAEAERQRAEALAQEREVERQARLQAEARIRELEARLREQSGGSDDPLV